MAFLRETGWPGILSGLEAYSVNWVSPTQEEGHNAWESFGSLQSQHCMWPELYYLCLYRWLLKEVLLQVSNLSPLFNSWKVKWVGIGNWNVQSFHGNAHVCLIYSFKQMDSSGRCNFFSAHKLLASVTACVGGASLVSAYHNSVLVSELDFPPLAPLDQHEFLKKSSEFKSVNLSVFLN